MVTNGSLSRIELMTRSKFILAPNVCQPSNRWLNEKLLDTFTTEAVDLGFMEHPLPLHPPTTLSITPTFRGVGFMRLESGLRSRSDLLSTLSFAFPGSYVYDSVHTWTPIRQLKSQELERSGTTNRPRAWNPVCRGEAV